MAAWRVNVVKRFCSGILSLTVRSEFTVFQSCYQRAEIYVGNSEIKMLALTNL